ncbi:asparagine synthase (glutamine-hydrolyzing) [Inhella inkyongensis]|uniref:asparagine synthase (glutamine-hydrolyzing) n=2 Tax=Inhella inkyongensis TaxID=392593 RepID=A0A840S2E5_9BURK|nr:asparagine synthase (glutamine-hydrolyzing) [Inhella inkyongensis]
MLAKLQRMSDALVHRGPDSAGAWFEQGVALGHRRLAIVDLSPAGHQPMASACGRYVLAFNGEIYNHLALRQELEPQSWRGHSDTETILAALSAWGFEATLARMVGMFALAVWDRQQRRLLLARDRMGEKPLYYGRLPCGDFVFASELKALRAHPRWQGEVDRGALALYMRHNAVPGEHSIFQGVRKLRPGHWLTVGQDGSEVCQTYWDLGRIASHPSSLTLDPQQAVDRLEALLTDAIRDQMIADVPLGAFLSGGVDSSTIVALMQRIGNRPVRTFSIGFEQPGLNEAEHAKAVARHLGTEHTELYVSAQDALDVIPRLPQIYDEPFADSSQIPTHLVARLARQHVTVALSGDGGDELFAGYNRYLLAQRIWHHLDRIPLGLRRLLARGVLAASPGAWDQVIKLLPQLRHHVNPGDKLHKFADNVLTVTNPQQMYRALVSHWANPSQVVLGARESSSLLEPGRIPSLTQAVDQMALTDQLTYLPDDILVKVDRAAMAVSLETRVPLLDHRVVEFAWQLPLSFKLRHGQTKWLLRQLLYRHVPQALIDRPKQGFAVPLDQWLRGPLRDWAQALLDPRRLRHAGFLDAELVQQRWQEHLRGRRNWQYLLWDVLMFEAWRDSL